MNADNPLILDLLSEYFLHLLVEQIGRLNHNSLTHGAAQKGRKEHDTRIRKHCI